MESEHNEVDGMKKGVDSKGKFHTEILRGSPERAPQRRVGWGK